MEKISWTDHVRNEEVLLRDKKERNILQTEQRRKGNWIGHIWRGNSLLKQVTETKREGRITVTVRRGIRRKQLLDDLKETRGCWKLKDEALDHTLWRTRFGRSYGRFVRLRNELIYMNRVIHKSLRDSRPLRYSSRDGHAEGEHVNRGRDTPSFCPTLQVLDMFTSEGS